MAYRNDDIFSFSAFDPAKLTDSFREFAEKGAAQSREAYAKVKAATEEATKTVETTMQSAQAGSVEVGLKAIEALRTNADLSLSHMESLLGVKSVAEFVELQTSFVRKQAELTVDQARSIQDATRKLAEAVSQPGKEAAEKAMSTFKAA
ncbi:Phasin [Pseudorhizobium banfieldiae]|uniref:Phasin n=1 Tax=Pseudorhizobium banfieldiae TaxID=1125847 RepID=L0NCF4_9HYPH|nr:phasin [Pseudorhizobium banfieldiae]CAD6599659.1 phasin [arsenite-oxidising bacterium NT-25]CAD6604789.1 phasin [Rhizobium sp. TCK]CCF18007.1 Phasin [Pseudorhizobium banfieldiae]